jgi:hypothetical protein
MKPKAKAAHISWAPRVKPTLIKQLYESDAAGLPDQDLLDEVGYALLVRCETIQCVTERRCPRCRERLEGAFPDGSPERPISCPGCKWTATWDVYHRSYKGHRIHGGRAYPNYLVYIEEFKKSRTVEAKMLSIDRLLHALHETIGVGASPAALNLIEERQPGQVRELLDQLAYGTNAGSEREGLRQEFLTTMRESDRNRAKHYQEIQQRWMDQDSLHLPCQEDTV